MNKDRFHNALALSLGYARIVNDKRITIKVDYKNPDDPKITLELSNGKIEVFNASEELSDIYPRITKSEQQIKSEEQELKVVINAVHQAYIEAKTRIF